MYNLKEYFVHYTLDNEDYIFRCWAEDKEHAKEQCLNAEPNCLIEFVELR
jgi:hypothetical protein